MILQIGYLAFEYVAESILRKVLSLFGTLEICILFLSACNCCVIGCEQMSFIKEPLHGYWHMKLTTPWVLLRSVFIVRLTLISDLV
jgi:hypothetical protein